MWDVYKDGAWWNAPPEQMFQAYYMTLREHYGYPAWKALARARGNSVPLGIGKPGGFIGLMREALRGRP